jgi:enamine deaminase RidA (YjgF/YER057c/UK114 family)
MRTHHRYDKLLVDLAILLSQEFLMAIYERLKELGIDLPIMAAPVAAYLPFVQTGNLLFLSGQLARKDGAIWVGQFGTTMQLEDGKMAAKTAAINLIATLHSAVGDLNRIKRIVKLMSLVNSSPTFTDHHLVTNSASELFVSVFGENGAHARSAFGVAQIPLGACVEIELIAEIYD